MGLFSKKSNPEPPKIDPKQQGKESDVARNQKYMHTPKHAYIDALNSTAGAYTSENRILIKEAAERRKSRLESESSFASNGRARLSGPWDSQISSNSRKEEKPAASRESHAKHSSTNSSGMRSAKKEYRRSALGTMAESSLEEAESISEHVTLPHIENPVKSPSAASSYTCECQIPFLCYKYNLLASSNYKDSRSTHTEPDIEQHNIILFSATESPTTNHQDLRSVVLVLP